MTDWMRKVLESKRATRQRLQQLPFAEKVKLLEMLRDRSLLIMRSRPKWARGAASPTHFTGRQWK
jgi:hypothetical protein